MLPFLSLLWLAACAQGAINDTLKEMRAMNKNMAQMNENTSRAIDTMAGIQEPIETMASSFNKSFSPEQINTYVENALASFEERMDARLDEFIPFVKNGTETLKNMNLAFASVKPEEMKQLGPALVKMAEFATDLNDFVTDNANLAKKSLELFEVGTHQLQMSNQFLILFLRRTGFIDVKDALYLSDQLTRTASSTGDLANNLVQISKEHSEKLRDMIETGRSDESIPFLAKMDQLIQIGSSLSNLLNINNTASPLGKLLQEFEELKLQFEELQSVYLNADQNATIAEKKKSLIFLAEKLIQEIENLNQKFSWFK